MNRPACTLLLLCAFAWILPASASTPTPPATSTAAPELHVIGALEGTARVQRAGWSRFGPALFGTALHYGDLLRLEPGARVTVVCADLTPVVIVSTLSGVPCDTTTPLLVYHGSSISPTRAAGDAAALVIAPRRTRLLGLPFAIRWAEVPGATAYQVQVRGPGVRWSDVVEGAHEIVYPEDAPPLVPGEEYRAIVTVGGASVDVAGQPGQGFSLLAPEEAGAVREAEARLRGLNLGEPATRYLVATLYAAHGLNADAIAQLEALAGTLEAPAVVRWLGELYLRVGLNDLARDRYRGALALSEQAGDVEGQALARRALARLAYCNDGNASEAALGLQQAQQLYEQLGASGLVEEIGALRARLEAQPADPAIWEQICGPARP